MAVNNAPGRANQASAVTISQIKDVVWSTGRILVLLATLAIVLGLLLWPKTTLPLLWDLLIPILPATFFVTPQFWRGLCPLATLNQCVGGRFRLVQLNGRLLTAANVMGIVLLLVMVATRRVIFNEDGTALAVTILAVIALAVFSGAWFHARAGFCNSICPILPIERLYGQYPLVALDNHRCHPCIQCIPKGCLEVDQRKSIAFAVRTSRGDYGWLVTSYGVLAASLPGFVIGYFTERDVMWWKAGALGDAVCVYFWIAGCSLVSYLITLMVVGTFRLDAGFSLAVLAACAGTLYYWWAALLIVKTLQLSPIAVWPVRVLVYVLLVVWLIHATVQRRRPVSSLGSR